MFGFKCDWNGNVKKRDGLKLFVKKVVQNQFIFMFEIFRDEFDQYYDCWECIIKVLRDIMVLSKKM